MSTGGEMGSERRQAVPPELQQRHEPHVVGADGHIYNVHPLPEITSVGYRFGQLIEPLSDHVPPGAIAKTFVYGSAVIAVGLSIRRRDTVPLKALAVGHTFGGIADGLLSLVPHRVAPHGTAEVEPQAPVDEPAEVKRPIFEALRFGAAALGGVRPNRAVPMHRIHHRFTDTPLDPHSPTNHGRMAVHFGIIGITQQTEKSNPELVAAEEVDYRSRKRWYDDSRVAVPVILGTHMLVGKALGIPVKYRLASAALQVGDTYELDATFTADSHMSGEPKDIDMGLLSWLFPEGRHENHHRFPRDPRHSKVDPVYAFLRFLKSLGQARIPGEHYHDIHGKPHFQEHEEHHIDGAQVPQ